MLNSIIKTEICKSCWVGSVGMIEHDPQYGRSHHDVMTILRERGTVWGSVSSTHIHRPGIYATSQCCCLLFLFFSFIAIDGTPTQAPKRPSRNSEAICVTGKSINPIHRGQQHGDVCLPSFRALLPGEFTCQGTDCMSWMNILN